MSYRRVEVPKGLARPRLVGIPGFAIDNRLFFGCLCCTLLMIFSWQWLFVLIFTYAVGRGLAAYDEYIIDDQCTKIAWRVRTGWTGMLVDEAATASPSKFATQPPPPVI